MDNPEAPGEQPWELWAIRYAVSDGRSAWQNEIPVPGRAHSHETSELHFYVWLARQGERAVLVDGGASREVVEERGFVWEQDPLETMRELGVQPEQVSDVVVTHLHWDHAGNLDRLPTAQIHVTGREWEWASGSAWDHPFVSRPLDRAQLDTLGALIDAGRVTLQGMGVPVDIAPGVAIRGVGGHTAGTQIVRVRTARGPVVLAGDCAHTQANLVHGVPYPVFVDLSAYLSAQAVAREWAGGLDRVLPGHDPGLRDRFPEAAASGLALALHVPGRDAALDAVDQGR